MDRRQFVGQTLSAVIVLNLARDRVQADQIDLLDSVDPLLRPKARIDDAENAYPLILKASRALTDMPVSEDGLDDCIELDCSFWGPKSDQKQDNRYSEWLDANEKVLASLETAVRRGKLQYPQLAWSDDRFETISDFSRLADLMQLQAQRQAAKGDTKGAIAAARLMANTFRLLKSGGGMYVEYLTAIAREADSWRLIRRLAELPQVNAAQLHELLSVVRDYECSSEAATSVIQSEFCFYLLPELRKIGSSDRKKLFEVILGWHENFQPLVGRTEYERRCRLLNAIFEGHPCPFSVDETAHFASEGYSGWIRDLELPWSRHDSLPQPAASAELAEWPNQLGLSLFDGEDSSNVDEKQIARARKVLASVKNPVGKRLIETVAIDSKSMHRAVLLNQAQLEGTRAVLALWMYERQKGGFPPNLAKLVEAKILERVPFDPFTGDALSYSHLERVVWSVGPDGNITAKTDPADNDDVKRCLWRICMSHGN